MPIILIWIIAAAISAIPLGWLVLRNPRALPIGAFLVALILFVPFGSWAVANSGWDPSSRPRQAAVAYATTVVVLGVLALLSLFLLQGSPARRATWTVVSTIVWSLVAGIAGIAYSRQERVRTRALNEEYLAPIRTAEAEAKRLREELDRAPERRRAVIDSALAGLEAETPKSYEKIERFLVFGDAAGAPGAVIVWGVLTVRPESPWETFGYYGQQLHYRLNERLRLRGYPAKVALGFAPTADVEAAGGDRAYFGADGATRVPQYPQDFEVVGNVPRPMEKPRKRGDPEGK